MTVIRFLARLITTLVVILFFGLAIFGQVIAIQGRNYLFAGVVAAIALGAAAFWFRRLPFYFASDADLPGWAVRTRDNDAFITVLSFVAFCILVAFVTKSWGA